MVCGSLLMWMMMNKKFPGQRIINKHELVRQGTDYAGFPLICVTAIATHHVAPFNTHVERLLYNPLQSARESPCTVNACKHRHTYTETHFHSENTETHIVFVLMSVPYKSTQSIYYILIYNGTHAAKIEFYHMIQHVEILNETPHLSKTPCFFSPYTLSPLISVIDGEGSFKMHTHTQTHQ